MNSFQHMLEKVISAFQKPTSLKGTALLSEIKSSYLIQEHKQQTVCLLQYWSNWPQGLLIKNLFWDWTTSVPALCSSASNVSYNDLWHITCI